MAEDARKMCISATLEALSKFKIEKDQSQHVKKALEAWNGALWMVVIGSAFGASVAHENNGCLLFRVGRTHVLCFQSFDEGALINTNAKKAGAGPKAEAPKEEEAEGAAEAAS